jgi:hypothetical protein
MPPSGKAGIIRHPEPKGISVARVPRLAAFALVLVALLARDALPAAPKSGKYPDRPWGAVAYNTRTGQYGYATDYRTRRAAESEAFRQCGTECDLVKSFRDTCAAVAAKGRVHAWDTGSSQEIAEMKARRKCGGEGCKVMVWACTSYRP